MRTRTTRQGSRTLRIVLAILLATISASLGCRREPSESESTSQKAKTHTVTGTVVSVNLKLGEARIAHDEIPGFMEAMTMPFPVADPSELAKLKPGDQIRATLVPANPFYRLEHVVIVKRADEAENDGGTP